VCSQTLLLGHLLLKDFVDITINIKQISVYEYYDFVEALLAATPFSPLRDICLNRVSRAGHPSVDNLSMHFSTQRMIMVLIRLLGELSTPLSDLSTDENIISQRSPLE
jgi:hypothetical protein